MEESKITQVYLSIIFIPHGVDHIVTNKQNTNDEKIKLGYFGFLHPYKGPEILMDLYKSVDKTKFSLNFFGGASSNLEKDKHYQKYLKNLYGQAKRFKVKISGLVKEGGRIDILVKLILV